MTEQTQHNTQLFDLALVVDWLKSQNYRVTRPFTPRTSYCDSPSSANLLKVAILDTETTGVNLATDKIIELGIVIAEYCPKTGQVYRVLETYNECEDPGMPIPPASTKIHGITDEMVQGKKIIDSDLQTLIEDVSLIIAHNAAFDRNFVEKRFPFFQDKAWACSFSQIPWKNENLNSAALEFLAYRFGFHFEGHRASIDCHALLETLQSDLPISGLKAFKVLLDASLTTALKIWALKTPFESKDKLKERGYRWDTERKTWYKLFSIEDVNEEKEWLRSEVYDYSPFRLEQERIDAFNRFSNRPGVSETVNC